MLGSIETKRSAFLLLLLLLPPVHLAAKGVDNGLIVVWAINAQSLGWKA